MDSTVSNKRPKHEKKKSSFHPHLAAKQLCLTPFAKSWTKDKNILTNWEHGGISISYSFPFIVPSIHYKNKGVEIGLGHIW